MTKNNQKKRQKNGTFAGGKNCIFLEALSFFFGHFSVIFLKCWCNFLKSSEKDRQFLRKMTEK